MRVTGLFLGLLLALLQFFFLYFGTFPFLVTLYFILALLALLLAYTRNCDHTISSGINEVFLILMYRR